MKDTGRIERIHYQQMRMTDEETGAEECEHTSMVVDGVRKIPEPVAMPTVVGLQHLVHLSTTGPK